MRNSNLDTLENFDIIELEEVSSTIDYAKDLLGKDKNFLVIADKQTSGKGQKGRVFESPIGTGVYMSIVINCVNGENLPYLTPLAGVAVCRTLRKFFKTDAKIKWVNDVYIDNKKVSGILTECVTDDNGNIKGVIVGIGVNLYLPLGGFITEKAGYVSEKVTYSTKIIAREIAQSFMESFDKIDTDKTFMKEYKKLSLVLHKTIEILENGKSFFAFVSDIDDKGYLIVRLLSGEIRKIIAGEVSIKL